MTPSPQPTRALHTIDDGRVRLAGTGPLASLRSRTARVTVPTMGDVMFDAELAGAYHNFLVAAGAPGEHIGPTFMDGDLYKWLEAAASVAVDEPVGSPLRTQIDDAVSAIAAAQRDDGYLHTTTQIAQRDDPSVEELSDLTGFETYNFGHLMTAAVALKQMLGDARLLAVAESAADFIAATAVEHPDKLALCNICPSHLMGVLDLARETGRPDLVRLADRLIELHGGKGRAGSNDNQDVLPVRDQREVIGHAVRANYLYAGLADYALETGDPASAAAADALWDDLIATRVYVTGGCGALYDGAGPDGGQDASLATPVHQAYGRPYQLPQITAYNESCASVGLVLFAWRMLQRTGDSRFVDEIERVLYNALPASIGFDAMSYFYTNPLRQVKDLPFPLRRAGDHWHSTPPPSQERARQEFMSACFCCPPNMARLAMQIPRYVFSTGGNSLWVHLFAEAELATRLGGVDATVRTRTSFPLDGRVDLEISVAEPVSTELRIRIPGWAAADQVRIDGAPATRLELGYAVIDVALAGTTTVTIDLPVTPTLMAANPLVEEIGNRVCVTMGPVVFCLESADLPDDVEIGRVGLSRGASLRAIPGEGIFAGWPVIETEVSVSAPWDASRLYAPLDVETSSDRVATRLVPYGLWANRGPGEMSVWLDLWR